MDSAGRLLQRHPHWKPARAVLERLRDQGHRALLAGGCVRDALLGRVAKDLDIATSAVPDKVISLFAKTVPAGKSFGVIRVLEDGADLEVATFRRDIGSTDGRRPDHVTWSDEKEDALRRDFTVNALFYDPESDQVLDYVGGRADLGRRLLRAVGQPELRFAEDHLRLLRALRFSVQLGFEIEAETARALTDRIADLKSVSGERVRDELHKLLQFSNGPAGPALLHSSGALRALFPRLLKYRLDGDLLDSGSHPRWEWFARWMAPIAVQGGVDDARASLSELKLSRVESAACEKTLEILSRPGEFWSLNFGRQLRNYGDVAVSSALSWGNPPDPRLENLRRRFQQLSVDGVLPSRWVVGDDLLSVAQGARLGQALELAYDGQLEGRFVGREAALTWAREWLRMGPNESKQRDGK